MRVILASASPRRRELLSALIDEFEVVPSEIDEPLTGEPIDNAEQLAMDKAIDVFARHPDALVIASDTIVFRGERSYGKPADDADVLRMWSELRGRSHQVVTAVALLGPGFERLDSDVASVELTDLDDDTVRAYAASGRPRDKAGAYAIQDADLPAVARFEGCYCCVMGLPLYWLKDALEEAGVPCRDPAAVRPECRDCGSRPG